MSWRTWSTAEDVPCPPEHRAISARRVFACASWVTPIDCTLRSRPAEGLYLVVDGIIKVSRLLENGDQVIVDIYQADEIFGESALLAGESQEGQATALGKAKLMIWSARQIRDLILNRPGLGWALMQTLVRRTIGLTERIESFARDNTACRLARTLLRFCERFGVLEKDGALRMASGKHVHREVWPDAG